MWIANHIQNGKWPIVQEVAHRNELAKLERERISMNIASGCKLFNRQKDSPRPRLAQIRRHRAIRRMSTYFPSHNKVYTWR